MGKYLHRPRPSLAGGAVTFVILYLVLVVAGIGVWAWDVSTCAKWETRTQLQTTCQEIVEGWEQCNTIPVDVRVCVARKDSKDP